MDPYGSMAVWEGTANPPSYSQLYPSPTFFWEGTWWIHRDSSLIFWHNLPNGELELLEQKHVWNLPFSTVYTVPPKNQQPIRGMILHVVRSQIQPNPAESSSRIQQNPGAACGLHGWPSEFLRGKLWGDGLITGAVNRRVWGRPVLEWYP